jgi:hypothetical protein
LNVIPSRSNVSTELGDRNAALLLDLHPVGAGAAALAARLDLPGEPDGAAGQQQSFGQRRLAGVGCEMMAKVRRVSNGAVFRWFPVSPGAERLGWRPEGDWHTT